MKYIGFVAQITDKGVYMLVKYILKKWPLLVAYIVLVFVAPVINVNASYTSGEMMDQATAADYQTFIGTLMIFLGYFILHGALLFFIQTIRIRLVSFCRRDLKQDMFRQVMFTDNTFFSKPDMGFHIAAFSNDITILESKYFEAWLEAIESIIAVVTAIVAVFNLNTKMAWVIVSGEIFSIVLCYLIRGYSMTKNRIYIENLAKFTQRIKDFFASFQTIYNYSVENQIKKRFNRINTDTERSKDEADMSIAFVDTLAKVCNSLIKFIIVGYGITLMMRGKITIGLIYTAYQFTNQLVGPMHSIISKINAIESVKSIVNRIKSIANASAKETKQEDIKLHQPAILSFNNVSVDIDGKEILKGITHTFYPGKKYLIIGRNGAGKSTLLRLLKRSIDDFHGSISINGQDIRHFSYKSLCDVVSYINESVSLICDTVRQNIVLYRDISEKRVQEVVDMVGLKVNLDRVVRDGERNMSSGETRRIEIARSLLNKADVIVYDEAISTLDILTAYEIEKTLLSLREQTVIFVSHNFSSLLIDQYDQIIMLDSGKICGCGTHNELMKTNEYYRHIMNIKNG